MRAFIPVDIIGTSKLISSDINEPDTTIGEFVYSAAIPYGVGDLVIDSTTHRRWKSLIDSNTGNTPDPDADTAQWKRDGYSNKYRMFDWNSSRFSVAPSGSSFTIAPGQRITDFHIDGISARQITVTVTDGNGGPVVFGPLSFDLRVLSASTPWEFTYQRFDFHTKISSFSVPPGSVDPHVTVTAVGINDGNINIGRAGVGIGEYLGKLQWSPVIDGRSFSEVDRSIFGESTLLTKRESFDDEELELLIDARRVDALLRLKKRTDAQAVFWSGLDDMNHKYARTLLLGGIHRRYQINLSNLNEPKLFLRLESI